MANILNDRDEILQAASSRLNVVSSDYISFSASAPSFTVNGSTVTPSTIVISFIMNGRLEGTPTITTSGVSSVTNTNVSPLLTQVSVPYANLTADTCTITASLTFAGNLYTSTASISGSMSPPAQVGTVSINTEGLLLRLSWPSNTEIDVSGYEIRDSDTGWGTSTPMYLFKGNSTSFPTPILAPTTVGSVKTFYIKAYDATNLYSTLARSVSYTVSAPLVPTGLTATYSASSATTSTVLLTWDTYVPPFGLKTYKVVVSPPIGGSKTWFTSTPNLTIDSTWTGTAVAVVSVIDILGNESSGSTPLNITKNAPSQVTLPATPVSVVGTKLLLNWNDVTKVANGLPIVSYEVRTSNINWGDNTTHVWKGAVSECQVAVGALNTLVTYYVKAVDSDSVYSDTATSFLYTRTAPPAIITSTYEFSTSSTGQSNVTINWDRPVGETFAIDYYKLSITKPGPVVISTTSYASSWTLNADWEGAATLTIETVDILGAISSTFTKTIYKTPINVSKYTTGVPTPVTNTLLLSWTPVSLVTGISWSRVGTVATITDTAHGYVNGNTIEVSASSSTLAIPVGTYVITYINANSYSIICNNAGLTTGTISITNGSLQVANYEIRSSNNTTVIYRGSTPSYAVQANNITLGLNTYYLYAIDSAGKYSSIFKTITYTYVALSGITGNAIFTSTGTALYKWNKPSIGSFDVLEYAVSLNGPGGSATLSTTEWEVPGNWSNGTVTLTITPKDVLGTVGSSGSIALTNTIPSTPGAVTPTLRGTNLDLDWPDNVISATQLPISRYELRDDGGNLVWKGSQSKATISLVGITPAHRTWSLYAIDTMNVACLTPKSYEYTNLVVPSQIPAVSTSYSFGTNISDSLLTLTWGAQTPTFGLKHYKIVYQDNGTTITATSLGNSINISPIPKGYTIAPNYTTGDKVFTISVVDLLNNESPTTGITVTKNAPGTITNYTAQVIDNNVLLSWTLPTRTTLPIDSVRIKRGAEGSTWNSAQSIGDKTGTFTTVIERSGSTYVYWIAAVDTDGVESVTPISITATVSQPPDYVFVGQQFSKFTGGILNTLSTVDKGTGVTVLDNVATGTGGAGGWQSVRGTKVIPAGKWYWEVTLVAPGTPPSNMWIAGVSTSALLVGSQYVGFSASSWGYYASPSNLIGPSTTQVASGASAFIVGDVLGLALDTVAGTLKFYKNGTYFNVLNSVTGSLYPAISTYGYQDSLYANFGEAAFSYAVPEGYNGYTNAVVSGGSLLLPVDTSSTWSQHFVNNAWASPDAQIAAGYPLYIQPTLASGSYEEWFDFGAILSSTKITVNILSTTLNGTVTPTTTISTSPDNSVWTTYTGTSVLGSNFRYVKIKITATQADGGKGTFKISGLDIALDSKQKSDSNTVSMAIGAAHPQGNIAPDYVSLWLPTPAALPTTNFPLNGISTENIITTVAGPGGYVQPVWNCLDMDIASDAEGGWNSTVFPATLSQGHLFAVFMKTTTAAGTSYFGTSMDGTIADLSGTVNANPYFFNGDLPALNTWYLVVGYVHEIGYGTTDTNISGVYDVTGNTRLLVGSEFKAVAGATNLMHRAYHYYNPTGSSTIAQQMARPVVIPCSVANAVSMIKYIGQCATGYGATVTPSTSFVDIVSVTTSPLGATPSTPLVDFTDVPYPKRFNIFNYNSAGSLVSGSVSWLVRGY